MESAICPCGKEEQTTDHLLYRCPLLHQQRETLKRESSKQGTWSINKQELIAKHLKTVVVEFTNLGAGPAFPTRNSDSTNNNSM
jgi:hypothetical protein